MCVVGAGNAGYCAAHAAAEAGAEVVVLEKAPRTEAGGNSYYTAGAFRVAFDRVEELLPLVDDDDRIAVTDIAPYRQGAFLDDWLRVTEVRGDAHLAALVVSRSLETVRWLAGLGIPWRLMYERQAYPSGARWRFFGGLPLGTVGGGRGLISAHHRAARRRGVQVRFDARVTGLLREAGTVVGVAYEQDGTRREARADAVVLAAGGFEASADARARWLGEPWRQAIVRGTPHNTGEVIELAVAAGAARHGDWSSCHSVAWDAGAPPGGGDRRLTNQLTRQSYPLGIVVNRHGRRFLDEGADFRNYTYARYGREILGQPGAIAFQIFDGKTRALLRAEEYDSRPISEFVADSVETLASAAGIDPAGLAATVSEFNATILDRPFDPSVKDGRAALVQPPKSNWAVPLDTPPFFAYAVGCGITFTFGGLHVDTQSKVLDADGAPIPGLCAAGEIVGGLFSGNYPGGTGLTAGAVLGRIAGEVAAESQTRHIV